MKGPKGGWGHSGLIKKIVRNDECVCVCVRVRVCQFY